MKKIDTAIISTPSNVNSVNSFDLAQASMFYNPYSVVINNKSYLIDNILFYNENGVQAKTGRGWFGENNHIRKITFKTTSPISRKLKVNFNINAPFIIPSDCNYEKRYDCYIPISDLPKFEVSYTKNYLFIEKYVDIGLPNPEENYVRMVLKYFDGGMKAREELREASKALDAYDIEKKSDKEFNDIIQNIVNLHEKMKLAYKAEENYTVEDYKRENNIG